MLDPSKLKFGQRIELKQGKDGKWQEWLIDASGGIINVENIDPFKYGKIDEEKANNFEELKKNYYQIYKKDDPTPFQLDLPALDNNDDIDNGDDINTPEEEPHIEDRDCGEGESGEPEIEEEEEKEADQEIKEATPDTDK